MLRHIISLMLVSLLVLMTGLSGATHALSNDCAIGHCDDLERINAMEHRAGHFSGESTETTTHGPHDLAYDECNPFLCNALALTLVSSKMVLDQSEAVLAWQVSSLAALEEPDNPDRPPNL